MLLERFLNGEIYCECTTDLDRIKMCDLLEDIGVKIFSRAEIRMYAFKHFAVNDGSLYIVTCAFKPCIGFNEIFNEDYRK